MIEGFQQIPQADDFNDVDALLPKDLQLELNELRKDQGGRDPQWDNDDVKKSRFIELQGMENKARMERANPESELGEPLSADEEAELRNLNRMQNMGRDDAGNEWGPEYFQRKKALEARPNNVK